MKHLLFVLLAMTSIVRADIYVVDDLYAIDTTGTISGDIILASPLIPNPFVQWEVEGYDILVPIAWVPNGKSEVLGTTPIGVQGAYAYWGDAACSQNLVLSMFEKEDTAWRIAPSATTLSYIAYLIEDDEYLDDTLTYYTVDNQSCNGPFTSEVPLNFATVVQTLFTISGNLQFIITEEDDSLKNQVGLK